MDDNDSNDSTEETLEGLEESLANPFLSNIPDSDRSIVEKYINDWDANVTKKFQSIHETYKPYKELGADPETLQSALELLTAINDDPENTLRILQEGYKEYLSAMDPNENDMQPEGGTVNSLPEFQGLPSEAAEYIKGLEAKTQKFEQFMNNYEKQQTEQQEMAQLDNILKQMHTKHGDFDDDYVLVQLANGLDPEKAIAKYNAFVEKAVNSRSKKPAANILGGNGSIPSGQVDASKIKDPKDRKVLISQILEAQSGA